MLKALSHLIIFYVGVLILIFSHWMFYCVADSLFWATLSMMDTLLLLYNWMSIDVDTHSCHQKVLVNIKSHLLLILFDITKWTNPLFHQTLIDTTMQNNLRSTFRKQMQLIFILHNHRHSLSTWTERIPHLSNVVFSLLFVIYFELFKEV